MMAYAEGVVGGRVHGVGGRRDCSAPCMWLDGGRCRLRKTDEPECLAPREPERRPVRALSRASASQWMRRPVRRDDGLEFASLGEACEFCGGHRGMTSCITRAAKTGGFAFGHRWEYIEEEGR